ncbi:SDR family NAD(P)-dependent oxidoreductase [Rhodococcus koreensis]
MTDPLTPDAGNRRAALVTGAGAGIGAAVAAAAARVGYDLLLIDLDEVRAKAVADKCRELGVTVLVRAGDVTDLDAMTAAVEAASGELGPLSAALHCAGIEVQGTVGDSDPSSWARCLDINVLGTFNIARAVMPHLIATRGAFTAVASDAGVTGAQGFSAYCASKHAVVGLIKCLALDYGPRGVRANAVAPGFVQTEMTDRIFADDPAAKAFYEKTVPLGRFATPEEIAAAMLHLSGPESTYTNGHIYRIDGGSTAGYFADPTAP